MNRRWLAIALAVIGMGILAPGRADAACTISSTAVLFGNYDVFATSPRDSTGTVSYQCDRGTNVRITLTRGSSPTYVPRTLLKGIDVLAYNIFLDPARSQVWGDETQGTVAYYAHVSANRTTDVTMHGRIPAAQDSASGPYSDTLTAIINF